MTKFLELLGDLCTTPNKIEEIERLRLNLDAPIPFELCELLEKWGYTLSLYDLADIVFLFQKEKLRMLKDVRDSVETVAGLNQLDLDSKAVIGLGLADFQTMNRQLNQDSKIPGAIVPKTRVKEIKKIFEKQATNMLNLSQEWAHPKAKVCLQSRYSNSVVPRVIIGR